MNCRTPLGSLIEEAMQDADLWVHEPQPSGSGYLDRLKTKGDEICFHKGFFGWRLTTPDQKLPRRERRILNKLAKRLVATLVIRDCRVKQAKEYGSIVALVRGEGNT